MNTIDLLKKNYSGFTKTQKKIADYILENKYSVSSFNMTELQSALGVSEASLRRFINALGFLGYKEFKKKLFNEVIASVEVMQTYNDVICEKKSRDPNYLDVVQKEIENINCTFQRLPEKKLDQVADLIIKAKRIGVVAFRGGVAPGFTLNLFLNQLLGKSIFIPPGLGDYHETINEWGKEDLVICFTFPYLNKLDYTASIMKEANKKGCGVILVTNEYSNNIMRFADISLSVETESAYASYTAAMVLVNVILYILNRRMSNEYLLERYSKTSHILDQVFFD